uniref:Actin-related protein 2/3 complex subunit 5 n=1 Tax=Plectus sambesii TaxID=2011161 RepID=A0A914XTV6_9BILA
MAKNMSNTRFRNIDVDAFDPEQFQDQDETGGDALSPGVGPDENQVAQLLQSNRHEEALKVALQNAPLKTKNQAVKDRATATVVRVLTSIKQTDMEKIVEKLSSDQLDLLMKYVYKGMEIQADDQTCKSLLAWHSHIFNKGGLGSIVRVMTDRRRL